MPVPLLVTFWGRWMNFGLGQSKKLAGGAGPGNGMGIGTGVGIGIGVGIGK
jgi:hypothetical protein